MAQHFLKKIISAFKVLYSSFYSRLLNNSDITLLKRTNGIAFESRGKWNRVWEYLIAEEAKTSHLE